MLGSSLLKSLDIVYSPFFNSATVRSGLPLTIDRNGGLTPTGTYPSTGMDLSRHVYREPFQLDGSVSDSNTEPYDYDEAESEAITSSKGPGAKTAADNAIKLPFIRSRTVPPAVAPLSVVNETRGNRTGANVTTEPRIGLDLSRHVYRDSRQLDNSFSNSDTASYDHEDHGTSQFDPVGTGYGENRSAYRAIERLTGPVLRSPRVIAPATAENVTRPITTEFSAPSDERAALDLRRYAYRTPQHRDVAVSDSNTDSYDDPKEQYGAFPAGKPYDEQQIHTENHNTDLQVTDRYETKSQTTEIYNVPSAENLQMLGNYAATGRRLGFAEGEWQQRPHNNDPSSHHLSNRQETCQTGDIQPSLAHDTFQFRGENNVIDFRQQPAGYSPVLDSQYNAQAATERYDTESQATEPYDQPNAKILQGLEQLKAQGRRIELADDEWQQRQEADHLTLQRPFDHIATENDTSGHQLTHEAVNSRYQGNHPGSSPQPDIVTSWLRSGEYTDRDQIPPNLWNSSGNVVNMDTGEISYEDANHALDLRKPFSNDADHEQQFEDDFTMQDASFVTQPYWKAESDRIKQETKSCVRPRPKGLLQFRKRKLEDGGVNEDDIRRHSLQDRRYSGPGPILSTYKLVAGEGSGVPNYSAGPSGVDQNSHNGPPENRHPNQLLDLNIVTSPSGQNNNWAAPGNASHLLTQNSNDSAEFATQRNGLVLNSPSNSPQPDDFVTNDMDDMQHAVTNNDVYEGDLHQKFKQCIINLHQPYFFGPAEFTKESTLATSTIMRGLCGLHLEYMYGLRENDTDLGTANLGWINDPNEFKNRGKSLFATIPSNTRRAECQAAFNAWDIVIPTAAAGRLFMKKVEKEANKKTSHIKDIYATLTLQEDEIVQDAVADTCPGGEIAAIKVPKYTQPAWLRTVLPGAYDAVVGASGAPTLVSGVMRRRQSADAAAKAGYPTDKPLTVNMSRPMRAFFQRQCEGRGSSGEKRVMQNKIWDDVECNEPDYNQFMDAQISALEVNANRSVHELYLKTCLEENKQFPKPTQPVQLCGIGDGVARRFVQRCSRIHGDRSAFQQHFEYIFQDLLVTKDSLEAVSGLFLNAIRGCDVPVKISDKTIHVHAANGPNVVYVKELGILATRPIMKDEELVLFAGDPAKADYTPTGMDPNKYIQLRVTYRSPDKSCQPSNQLKKTTRVISIPQPSAYTGYGNRDIVL